MRGHAIDSLKRSQAAGLATDLVKALITTGGVPTSRDQLQAEAHSWAGFWFAWLVAKQASQFTVTLITTSNDGKAASRATVPNGGTMSTQMTMDDTVTLAVKATDDHGDPTSDQLQFAADDNGAVLSLAVDGNTATGTPVGEGTVNITITDPAAPQVGASVVTIDVGPGPTSQIAVDVQVNTGANPGPSAG